ncbi:potassium channel subfamily K member 4-like [Cyprinus carpio]|uniref:Potassium channel subfamily K member 4-like n=1 Tax=Cyprinus carpio TaxID=7962 RepID=A0A9Q9VLU0_CYPCA|nr:potassium channel subfamily K member 4-like [Cyprinus carpio]
MHGSTLIFVLIGMLLYLIMGALVFNALEAPNEEAHHVALQATREVFLDSYTCVNPENLSYLIDVVAEAISVGVDPNSNATFSTSWDLASAFFFCGTIVTTIGYGNISPKTAWGQFFCICYTLVGIPLFGFLLGAVGDRLGTFINQHHCKISINFISIQKWKVSPTIVRVITAVLSILLGCVLFIFVPILVFQRVEEWTWLQSAYFVVITLTTVGFGDYVAGDGDAGKHHWYKPLVWFWVLFGLAYFVSILSMIGNWILVLTKKTKAEMEGLRAHASDWTQNIQNMSVDFNMSSSAPGESGVTGATEKMAVRVDSEYRTEVTQTGKEEEQDKTSPKKRIHHESKNNSESQSEETQTDRVPEGGGSDKGKDLVEKEKLHAMPKDPILSQPLDYFGENLAYIDESSDAVSGKIHLDPLLDVPESNPASTDRPKRRRQRRHLRRDQQKPKTPKTSPNESENKAPNGDIRQKDPPTPKL